MANVTLGGKTYNIRDMLKAKGGMYNPAAKTWTISADAWERISKLDNGRYASGVFVAASSAPVGMDDVTAMMTLNGTTY